MKTVTLSIELHEASNPLCRTAAATEIMRVPDDIAAEMLAKVQYLIAEYSCWDAGVDAPLASG